MEQPNGVDPSLIMSGSRTRGGVQKQKFVPTITQRQRPVKQETVEQQPRAAPPRGGRQRGGGISTARTSASVNAQVVSGPFSLGPAQVMASAGSRGRGLGGGSSSSSSLRPVPASKISDHTATAAASTIGDLAMGDPHAPLFFPTTIASTECNDQEEDDGSLFLLQLPAIIPQPLGVDDQSVVDGWPVKAEGIVGQLLVFKSGRRVLQFGPVQYDLETALNTQSSSSSTSSSTRLFAVDPDYGQSFDLGSISRSLVGIPHHE